MQTNTKHQQANTQQPRNKHKQVVSQYSGNIGQRQATYQPKLAKCHQTTSQNRLSEYEEHISQYFTNTSNKQILSTYKQLRSKYEAETEKLSSTLRSNKQMRASTKR